MTNREDEPVPAVPMHVGSAEEVPSEVLVQRPPGPSRPPPTVSDRVWRLGQRILRTTMGEALVLVMAFAYTIPMGWLALRKYQTFHASYADLGVENQVLWLLSHGGPSRYYGSHFDQIYPLQFQKPILFLLVPVYAAYPHPELLLVLASAALSFAAIPLFLFARRRTGSEVTALVVSGAYLLFFPVASANLFDFHYEDLLPFFFFSTCYLWSAGRIRWMLVAAALSAAINPLALITIMVWAVYTALPDRPFESWARWRQRLLANFRSAPWKFLLPVGLGLLLVVYRLAGVLYTAGAGAQGPSPGTFGILAFDVNAKVVLLVMLLGSLAFVPLLRLRSLSVAVPYLGYVLYSTNSANYVTFGLMYPLIGASPLVFAAVESLANFRRQEYSGSAPGGRSTWPGGSRLQPRWSVDGMSFRGYFRVVRSLALASILLGVVYFPFSPLNSYVQGGYFSGAHDVGTITTDTSASRFLAKVINLIPATGAVLTQNNIPQLTGREYVQIPYVYHPGIPYDYVLMDSQLEYFSSVAEMLPFVNPGLANGSFGVLAEGVGALLIERGFHGPPAVYVAYNSTLRASDLTPLLASTNGTSLVGDRAGFSMWYGPYATLYPGNYSVAFMMTSNLTTPGSTHAITLDVTVGAGSKELVRSDVRLGDFRANGQATTFVLNFHLRNVITGVEFRGMFPSGAAEITLLGIQAVQLTV